MPLDATQFRHEYDLEALEPIRPVGHDFEMFVTPRYRHHYLDQSYEGFTAALVRAMSRSHDLFVDIGAHFGFFSLVATSRRPEMEVLACEPVPESFEILARNASLNALSTARLIRKAVSDQPGTADFNISLASDNCSFYPHPVAPPLQQVEVETTSVDQLLAGREPCPTLVKMDTDGHELRVLAGMEATFERFPDLKLFIELNPKMQRRAGYEPEELLADLQRRGFEVYLLDDDNRRAYRLEKCTAWHQVMRDPASYANLYCCRKETSLSVAFFSHSASLSGAERSLLELASELVEDHGSVCTVMLPNDGPLVPRLQEAGVATIVTPYPWWCDLPGSDRRLEDPATQFLDRLSGPASSLIADLRPELVRINPHVVVTHTLVIPWGAVLAKTIGRPHVWHVCEYGELDHDLRFFLPFSEVLEGIEYSSDLVFTAIDGLRKHLFPSAPEGLCRTLYRHVEVPQRPPGDATAGPFRRPGALKLGLFGSYTEGKGQKVAVRAIARLRDRGHDVELLLAGHPQPWFLDDLRALVRQLGVEEIVQIVGFLDDVYAAMAETDVVLVGSRSEAFGRVAVEGMLLGKAVVYPDVGGPAEYMQDGVTGLMYRVGDDEDMADRIERLVTESGLGQMLGSQGQAFAESAFTRAGFGGEAARSMRALRGRAPKGASPWLALLARGLQDLARRNSALERSLQDLARQHRELEGTLGRVQDVLDTTLGSATWTVALWLRSPVDLLAPVGTKRRELLKGATRNTLGRLNLPR